MYPKFIITLDGTLRFGTVSLHKDLLPAGDQSCHGGGLWKIDNQRGIIILHGRSFDFGMPEFEYFKRVSAEGPGALGYPIFYQRYFGEEEVLEPIWPKTQY